MVDPRFRRVRVLCDYDWRGELIQVGWELWHAGEMLSTGMMPVGPFDTPKEVEAALCEMVGYQIPLDLS